MEGLVELVYASQQVYGPIDHQTIYMLVLLESWPMSLGLCYEHFCLAGQLRKRYGTRNIVYYTMTQKITFLLYGIIVPRYIVDITQ